MKNITFSSAIIFSILCISPQNSFSSETGLAKILTSLNSKTAKVKVEWQQEDKGKVVSKYFEVNSYVFSVDQKMLNIDIDEEIKVFDNDKFARSHHVFGKISFDIEQIDPRSLVYAKKMIHITCRDNKNCAERNDKIVKFNANLNVKKEQSRKLPTFKLQIRAFYERTSDKPIFEDIKNLLSLLVPMPEPPQKKPQLKKQPGSK